MKTFFRKIGIALGAIIAASLTLGILGLSVEVAVWGINRIASLFQ